VSTHLQLINIIIIIIIIKMASIGLDAQSDPFQYAYSNEWVLHRVGVFDSVSEGT
jgi:hypothetical protein